MRQTKRTCLRNVLARLLEEWQEQLDHNKTVGTVLLNLPKAFDCILHDLLIAKLNAYGFHKNTLTLLFSYLKSRKQSVRIKTNYCSFIEWLSGVLQGSILGTLLFNIFLNDLLLFISRKNNALPRNLRRQINNTEIAPEPSIDLLGDTLDNKLKFDQHISRLYKSAGYQLNALFRLKGYLNFEQKKVSIESFIYANFNYCPSVLHFFKYKSVNKTGSIQKSALQLLCNDFESNYSQILDKGKKNTMTIARLRCLSSEIYKTINLLNPAFMAETFKLSRSKKPVRKQSVLNLNVTRPSQVRYGERSLRV